MVVLFTRRIFSQPPAVHEFIMWFFFWNRYGPLPTDPGIKAALVDVCSGPGYFHNDPFCILLHSIESSYIIHVAVLTGKRIMITPALSIFYRYSHVWGLLCQKKVYTVWLSYYTPQNTAGCNNIDTCFWQTRHNFCASLLSLLHHKTPSTE